MRTVLKLPAFRRLLVATILNELAWWIGSVSIALLVYRHTGSAAGATAFFLCSQFGPALLSPLLVARIDQRAVHRILAVLYAAEGAIFLILAWLVTGFELVAILALVLVDGVLFLTARVLARAAWTSVSSPHGLVREANAVVNTCLSVCIMLGPALGGALVAIGGTRSALLVNVGMFGLIALLVGTAQGLPRAAPDQAPAVSRLRAAVRYMRGEPMIRRLLILQAAAIVFFTISLPIEVVFAQHTLHAGAGGYGVLLGAWGAGMIVGSAVYARWRHLPSRHLIALGAASLGAGFLVMAVAPSLATAAVGAAIAGVGNGSQYVAFKTALQEAAEERWMAMILSLNESVFQGAPGAGILLGGAITALAGPRPALAAGAVGSLVVALAMWIRLKPETRGDERVTQTDPATTNAPLTIGERGA
jgi:predicted MFS family arabinose efflux permease